jgi:hypothetical protein
MKIQTLDLLMIWIICDLSAVYIRTDMTELTSFSVLTVVVSFLERRRHQKMKIDYLCPLRLLSIERMHPSKLSYR